MDTVPGPQGFAITVVTGYGQPADEEQEHLERQCKSPQVNLKGSPIMPE